ncbi:uncharacterized protein LOC132203202 [Neocloeon triangulifer]|uniref:uncharacterized protein LOC132203202 n=1 Tax=Neocloeon triangulifer TaxID=2078957 RepID=UPI00286F3140|nr:uncharacterized protein LOC132203202 [Neocloeon triangulifer]
MAGSDEVYSVTQETAQLSISSNRGNNQNHEEAGDYHDDHASGSADNKYGDGYDGHHRGGQRGSTFRRGGRGNYRGRGRGGGQRQHQLSSGEEGVEGPSNWNGSDRDRGKGQTRRFYRGGGRQRPKSEKSSLLDGKREPLPDVEYDIGFEGVEDFWDVVVSGYGPDMTEEGLWEVFGRKDVADIVQFRTDDMKPYCHIYTTSRKMTDELLKCNRDMFHGNMLHVSISEDMIARSVSQILKKKPSKPKQKRAGPRRPSDAEAEDQPADQQQQDNSAHSSVKDDRNDDE